MRSLLWWFLSPELCDRHQDASFRILPAGTSRRYPPLEDYKVLDANGQALVCVHARETRNEASIAGVMTFDKARRIAVNVAKLPGLLAAK